MGSGKAGPREGGGHDLGVASVGLTAARFDTLSTLYGDHDRLHDYAGWFGEATPNGVRVSRTCMLEVVIDLAIDEREIDGMLVRLRPLGLGDSRGVRGRRPDRRTAAHGLRGVHRDAAR
jgi:hypothetical protein